MKLTNIGASLIVLLLAAASCRTNPSLPDARQILDKAIEAAGGHNYEGARVYFRFRDKEYRSYRKDGLFELERIQTDPAGNVIRDVLTNSGFTRFVNDSAVTVADTMAVKYSNSVNSVHYYAALPFGLGDAAVQPRYLGMATIGQQVYHKIEVTFIAEGGGTDYDDIYLYWIDPEDFSMDYFSYRYFSEGGGVRFRQAFNQRKVGGIGFADYHNYKAETDVDYYNIDSLFNANALQKLSVIELEDIRVTRD